jgi:hypothetical protein
MKNYTLFLSLFFLIFYKLIAYYSGEKWLSLFVFLPLILLLIINLFLRKKLRYKNWFLSSLNIFLDRKTEIVKLDFTSDLLFEKLLEVIEESSFKILDISHEKLQIVCGTNPNLKTWGENIYIQLHQIEEDSTNVEFISTTIFGGNSLKRNDKNFEKFMQSFEESLTI